MEIVPHPSTVDSETVQIPSHILFPRQTLEGCTEYFSLGIVVTPVNIHKRTSGGLGLTRQGFLSSHLAFAETQPLQACAVLSFGRLVDGVF
jgi:hypothetical protein